MAQSERWKDSRLVAVELELSVEQARLLTRVLKEEARFSHTRNFNFTLAGVKFQGIQSILSEEIRLRESDMALLKESLAMQVEGSRWVALDAPWVLSKELEGVDAWPITQAARDGAVVRRREKGGGSLPSGDIFPFTWAGKTYSAISQHNVCFVKPADAEEMVGGLVKSPAFRVRGTGVVKDPYLNSSAAADALEMLQDGAFAKVWESIRTEVRAKAEAAIKAEDYERLCPMRVTVDIEGKPLRTEAYISINHALTNEHDAKAWIRLGVHKDDMPVLEGLIGEEHRVAKKSEVSGREVAGMLGIEPVRLQGSLLWLAYQKGTKEAMEMLPEAYRGLPMRVARWSGSVRRPSLFAEDSSFPVLSRYFHAVNPLEPERYLDRAGVAKTLGVREDNDAFTDAWNALQKQAQKAEDGKDISLNGKSLPVGIKQKGALKAPFLHEDGVAAFKDIMQEGVKQPSLLSSISISAAGARGRKR